MIVIDSREKPRAIKNIISYFDKNSIQHISSKLYVGDYMSFDNPRLIVDRKQNLTEVCCNICQQHKRFADEMNRATNAGIKLIFLVEHGKDIVTLDDVRTWENPRISKYCFDIKKQLHIWGDYNKWDLYKKAKENGLVVKKPPTTGEQLYKSIVTIQENYCTEFLFCKKSDTGAKIVELLGGGG